MAAALVVMVLGTPAARSQIYDFVTIAGEAGTSGSADGTNTDARFWGPSDLTLDSRGNIYVADYPNNTIRLLTRWATNWVSSTIAGLAGRAGSADGTNSDARFSGPAGVAVDGAGNVFISDSLNGTIRELTPWGTNWVSSTIAGLAGHGGWADGTNNEVRFSGTRGLALDRTGNLFVVDGIAKTIRKLAPIGTNWVSTTIAGLAGIQGSADGTNSAARFGDPIGIALDGGGNLYVADFGNYNIRKLSPVGTNWVSSTIAGRAGYGGKADGTNTNILFNTPVGVALDKSGNLYVTDDFNSTIRKLTPSGTNWISSTIAGLAGSGGTADGTNSDARFNLPNGIAVSTDGNVFVSDLHNNTIREGLAFPVPPPAFQSVTQTNNLITFLWSAVPGLTYQLQYISDVTSTNWLDLGDPLTATNGTIPATDTLGPDPRRFYRVTFLP